MSDFDEMSRINIVLSRLKNLCQDDVLYRKSFLANFDEFLDSLPNELSEDPRGNQGIGKFNMTNVQGYDE